MSFFSSFGGFPFGGLNGGNDSSEGTNETIQIDKKLTTLHFIKLLEFLKMQAKNKLKSPIVNSLKNTTLIDLLVMLINSNKFHKHMRLSQTLKKEEFTINMDLKDLKLEVMVLLNLIRSFEHVFRRRR